MIENNNNDLLEIEIWKPILGYEGHYEVSNMGRVRSLERKVEHGRNGFITISQKTLKPGINSGGYKLVVLHKKNIPKSYMVHVLVAQAFLDYELDGKLNMVCDHIDNNKRNNNINNLQIITQRKNLSKDKIGTSKYTGASWYKSLKKWKAGIYINRNEQHLGYFDSEIDAHNEYQRALEEFKSTGKITRPMVLKRGK